MTNILNILNIKKDEISQINSELKKEIKKINELELSDEQKERIISQAKEAITSQLCQFYKYKADGLAADIKKNIELLESLNYENLLCLEGRELAFSAASFLFNTAKSCSLNTSFTMSEYFYKTLKSIPDLEKNINCLNQISASSKTIKNANSTSHHAVKQRKAFNSIQEVLFLFNPMNVDPLCIQDTQNKQ